MVDNNKSKEELLDELNRLQEDNFRLKTLLNDKEKFAERLIKSERFLSESALEFVELSMEEDIYELLAGKLGQLFKDSIILISAYDEGSDNFRIHSIFDQNNTVDEISRKFFGQGVIGMDVPSSTDIDSLLTGRLNLVEGGLHQLLLGRLPLKSCEHIEKLLDIGEVYDIGLSWKGRVYGAVTIGLNRSSKIDNKEIIEVLVNVAAVALQKRKAENKIANDEDRYRTYVDNAPYGIVITDENGQYLEVNDMVSVITGYSETELLNMGIPGLIPLNYLEGVMKELLSSQKTEKAALEFKFLHKNGETRYGAIKGVKLPKEGHMGFLTDITQRKMAEKMLQESEGKYRLLVESAKDLIVIADKEGTFTMVNDAVIRTFNLTTDNIVGKSVYELFPENAEELMKILGGILTTRTGTEIELPIIYNGKKIWFSWSVQPFVNSDGTIDQIQIIARDITNIKETQNELEMALKEKETLLKEIHHRVKNNLMVISSLLNLQSAYIKDKAALDVFRESQNRAKSMALIHERLYRSTDLKRIDFGDYIRTLATDLFHTYASDPTRINLNLILADIMVDINTAVPLGLIVNELITNCMKHAFPGDKSGEIKVQFFLEDENLVFKVSDDGVGFPENLDFKNTDSLGLKLVNSLTAQIDGEIGLDRTVGTEFKITFKEFGE